MSAISGIWDFIGSRDTADDCARMSSAQAVYGRDAEDTWSDGKVALSRRLAKLLPEDAHDSQPTRGQDSRLALVADLRLDNRDELAAALAIPAALTLIMCDADLLLAAVERWGEACCEHLIGDYAFAVWDARRHRLMLARDILGSRPLHYYRGERFFAFASMPKGLHALPEIPRTADEERVTEFLALVPEHGSSSFFTNIERVESGTVLTVTPAGVRVRRHWDWQRGTVSLPNSDEYVEALRHHLDVAVRSRLRGVTDQVAAHLSSGLDSSSVTTTAARLLAPAGGKVIAFTAVPRQGSDLHAPQRRVGDEGPLAGMTAAMHANIEHVLVSSGHCSPLATLDRDFFLYDRPILNLCNTVWHNAINDHVKARGINVLLTGDMGNMTISYDGAELLAELIRGGRWISWAHAVAAIVQRRHWRLRGALSATFSPWLPERLRLLLYRMYYGPSEIVDYCALHPAFLASLDLPKRARGNGFDLSYRPAKAGIATRLGILRWTDRGNYNKGVLGGWGIDMRDPTGDRRLIEFCLSVPTEQYFRNGVPRSLAREALADRVPPEVLNQRHRGYQAADWHEGLTAARPELFRELGRLEQVPGAARVFDLARMRRLTENWPAQGWERDDIIQQYRLALLRGISVGHFLRRASGSDG